MRKKKNNVAQASSLSLIRVRPYLFTLLIIAFFAICVNRSFANNAIDLEKHQKNIENDWLFQVDNNPRKEIIVKEIGYTFDLIERLQKIDKNINFKNETDQLKDLKSQADKLNDNKENIKRCYLLVRELKRNITFRNPGLNFSQILLVNETYPTNHHESGHRNGYLSTYNNSSGKLLLLKNFTNKEISIQNLLPENKGYYWRPDISFDAKKILYCFMKEGERSFNLHELDITSNKSRQLTNSLYDDLDPIYLPDGNIMFTTTRASSYVRCHPVSRSFILARCDKNGKNIYILSRNNEPDFLPTLLPDGRILYTRWEYTERPLWRFQGLWTVMPDGSNVTTYWGNKSILPDMLIDAQPIPNSNKILFVGAGHHNFFDGCLGIVDTNKGRNHPNGLYKITSELIWPESGNIKKREKNIPVAETASKNYHIAGKYTAYRTPYPITQEDFLVSIRKGAISSAGMGRTTKGQPKPTSFCLYLMDIHGNKELIFQDENNVWDAKPFQPRKCPPMRPSMIKFPKKGEKAKLGTLYSGNVYEGVDELKGKAKYLRVIQMDAKTYSFGFKSFHVSGPATSIIQNDGIKRILGTVPVEKDGSVNFKVPAGKALHFQLLDENYRCLQIMRSFTGVMPGETRGCVGCHELKNTTPSQSGIALTKPSKELTPPPWGSEVSIGYERFCQPILDKYCGKCHQGNGKARETLDLTLRGGLKEIGITDEKLLPFKQPYLTLIGKFKMPRNIKMPKGMKKVNSKTPGFAIAGCIPVEYLGASFNSDETLKPMTMLSYTSPLIKMVMTGSHKGVKIEGNDLRRLIAWIDTNCVYRGDKEIRQLPDPTEKTRNFNRFAIKPRVKTAPIIDRTQPINPTEDNIFND